MNYDGIETSQIQADHSLSELSIAAGRCITSRQDTQQRALNRAGERELDDVD